MLREHREPPVHQALMGPQERAVPQVQAELREAVALQAVRGQVEVQAPQLRRVLRGRADLPARQEHRQPLHLLLAIPPTALHGME